VRVRGAWWLWLAPAAGIRRRRPLYYSSGTSTSRIPRLLLLLLRLLAAGCGREKLEWPNVKCRPWQGAAGSAVSGVSECDVSEVHDARLVITSNSSNAPVFPKFHMILGFCVKL
jgi:hypothetical protein